jgi:hypothetical protein
MRANDFTKQHSNPSRESGDDESCALVELLEELASLVIDDWLNRNHGEIDYSKEANDE